MKTISYRYIPVASLATALLLTTGAYAQITFQPSTASFSAAMGAQQEAIQEDIHHSDWARGSRVQGAIRPRAPMPGPRYQAVVAVDTAYRPNPAVTQRVRRQFLDFVASSGGAQGRTAVADMFAKADPLRAWQQYAGGDGMRLGDVADAMAEYWVLNWMMANGAKSVPGSEVRAVRAQVRRALSNPGFARLDNDQRQEMAEVLIYNTMLQGEIYKELWRKGDRAGLKKIGDVATERFRREARLDLRATSLGDSGFVQRG